MSSSGLGQKVEPVFRPRDQRPSQDDRKLASVGIRKYESKHLKLYTDIDPVKAKDLPQLVDQAYLAWEAYFGKLPPNPEKTTFQVTGYLMKDKPLFRRMGLIPNDLLPFINGRHRGQEFWMNEQDYDYYRRHLVIHECTHCFMTILPGTTLPLWYLEGMAELFGTHTLDKKGIATFRVMPHNKEDFGGLGRITMIQEAIKEEKFLSLEGLFRLKPNDYLKNEPYAWSWALCIYFDQHPLYATRFRKLGQSLAGTQFGRNFLKDFGKELPTIRDEWVLFARQLQVGYQHSRGAIVLQKGKPLQRAHSWKIVANAGWQCSEIQLEKGKRYRVSAKGRFELAQKPIPWISEPQGISFRYFENRPLGELHGIIHDTNFSQTTPFHYLVIGKQKIFESPADGTLYLRLNDSWSELSDNKGSVAITIERMEQAVD